MAKKKPIKTPVKKAGVLKPIKTAKNDKSRKRTSIKAEVKRVKPNDGRNKQPKGRIKISEKPGSRVSNKPKQTRREEKPLTVRNKSVKQVKTKTVTAKPIKYDQNEINRLRRTVRKSDGTFFTKRYYEKILKKTQGKTRDEVDDVLIELRNKNPDVRYYVESKAPTLHFQTGNFVDRLEGKEKTVTVTGKGKKQTKTVKTGEIKKGSSITIRDFRGDEYTFKSIAKANEKLAEQNQIINNIIDRLKRETKLKKGKSLGVYFTVPETVTANSENEVTKISYDYFNGQVQGIEKVKFDFYLEDEL